MSKNTRDRQIAAWLIACAVLLLMMILLGGVTRLTQSGLSMVEWKPLVGVIPPISEEAWQQTFAKYQNYPEYQQINIGMTLPEFKSIFFFEYSHRLLGRLIGFLFLLPLIYFSCRGWVKGRLTVSLWTLFVLGGLQGLLGWYMVKSGLVNDPHVSQYRLTAHLGMALFIYACMLWTAFGLLFCADTKTAIRIGFKRYAYTISVLLFLMILSGGLVAGTKAGYAYNTFPLMGDSFFPAGLYSTAPAWLAAFEDITTIQFNHRMLAYLLFTVILMFAFMALRGSLTGRIRRGIYLLVGLLLLQVSLGITTLLSHVAVAVAAAHQGVAVLLFTAALYVSFQMKLASSPSDCEA